MGLFDKIFGKSKEKIENDFAQIEGMQNRFKTIIEYVKSSDYRAKIYNETDDSITLGLSNLGGETLFKILKKSHRIYIEWKLDSSVFGKHNLEWNFDEDLNQNNIIDEIENDLKKYHYNFPAAEESEMQNQGKNTFSNVESSHKWDVLLQDTEMPDDFRMWVINFFIPYNIDADSFLMHFYAFYDNNNYNTMKNIKKFSKNLKHFYEHPSRRRPGYPDWFYCAFPDVAMWAIHGVGSSSVQQELVNRFFLKNISVLKIDKDEFNDEVLKMIIDMYLLKNELECKKVDDFI